VASLNLRSWLSQSEQLTHQACPEYVGLASIQSRTISIWIDTVA
jgi:hypothetical protein